MKILPPNSSTRGFTLIELAVIIVVLGVVAVTLLPAMAKSKVNDQAFRCLNNTKQLAFGWQLYAQDNADRMVNSSQWVSGSMNAQTTPGGPWASTGNESDSASMLDANALMAPYVKSPGSLKCPSDKYQSAINAAPRVRSYSMNPGVGGTYSTIGGTYAADDPTNPRTYIQSTTGQRTSILNKPGPSKVWVFLDENPDSINDSQFQFRPGYIPVSYVWQDLPGSLHDGGCSVSFADGHSTIKKWADSRTTQPVRLLYKHWQTAGTFIVSSSTDYAWVNSGVPYR